MQTTRSTVAVISCASYDPVLVADSMERGLELLGGAHLFSKSGETLLFKPNLLYAAPAEKCVTTHPTVVAAAITSLSRSGAKPLCGDSSAIIVGSRAPQVSGIAQAAKQAGATMVTMESPQSVTVECAGLSRTVVLSSVLSQCQGVINLAKGKTHELTRVTGAVKNLFGCVPGLAKGRYHAQFPDINDFCELLATVAKGVGARLHIMDAIMAMEGRGPGSGDPYPLGALLLSTDPVALDTVFCSLIGMPVSCVPTIAAAERLGLGTSNRNLIDLVGDPAEPLYALQFNAVRRPPNALRGKGKIRSAIRAMLIPRPTITPRLCQRCGDCVAVCPATPKSLTFARGEKQVPIFDYSLCIRCFCCSEVCPHRALKIKNPILGRLLPVLNYLGLLASVAKNRLSDRAHA